MKCLVYVESKRDHSGIGVEWFLLRETPLFYIPKPDRTYYSGIHFKFIFLSKAYCISFLFYPMPYRNTQEHSIWLKVYRRKNDRKTT